ncbi:hypothetical protein [Fodinibius salsisoli]|uniref:Uncharacterized protein n=1 Tax=Fodinibius salsisoli TaxID=2820877 RepID=A0ABT3PTG2_9BACT|nr:hypothetical protein [Fodinibius salsisoli]MCW9709143.1 hypothetical protein [Fodinibius salsisoli]
MVRGEFEHFFILRPTYKEFHAEASDTSEDSMSQARDMDKNNLHAALREWYSLEALGLTCPRTGIR